MTGDGDDGGQSSGQCPVCNQNVDLLPRPVRPWVGGPVDDHLFTGDAPSMWLRPGEQCPAVGADFDTLNDETTPYRPPGYGEPGWFDDLFGGAGYRRRGRALAEHRYTLDVATGGRSQDGWETFWPHVYGPTPH